MLKFKKTKKFWDNNNFLILSLIPLALIILFQPQQEIFIPSFFGDEKSSLFDLWSIQHFLAGVLIGSLFLSPKDSSIKKERWQKIIPFILFIAFGWEALEIYLEKGIIFAEWNSFEHWTNRIITDPLTALVGGVIGYSKRNSWKIVIIPIILWLALKLFLI